MCPLAWAQNEFISAEEVVEHIHQIVRDLESPTELFEALGDREYSVREDATQRLIDMPVKHVGALLQLAETGSAEQAYRARRILREADQQVVTRHQRIIHFFIQHRTRGMAKEVLTLIEHGNPEMRMALQEALLVTLEPTDCQTLSPYVADPRPYMRQTIAIAMGHLKDDQVVEPLLKLARDSDENVRLAVAGALARHQRKESVSILLDMLDSSDEKVHASAANLLQGITGKNFGLLQRNSAGQRATAIERWRTWLSEQDDNLKLRRLSELSTMSDPFE